MFNIISKKKAATQTAGILAPLVKAYTQLQLRFQQQSNLGFTVYGYANQSDQIGAYASIDDLYAIVNRIMKTAALIPIYEYVITDEKAYGQYKIKQRQCAKHPTNQNIYEVKRLQTKAMELAGEGSPLQDFLNNPNKFQSKSEFYQLTYLFKLLTGNYYIKKDSFPDNPVEGGANAGKLYEMYNLPPNFTQPIPSESIPRRCVGYKSTLYNLNQFFEKEEVIHGRYVNPVFDYGGSELVGLSPLQAGARTLTTIGNEIDYQNQALRNAGAGGVIVNEDPMDLTPEALGSMKDDVLRELGSAFDSSGRNINANKLAFLAGKWNYLKIFIDPANMQLLEQRKATFKRLCNDYGISANLFNEAEGLKYDNYDIALRELYTNAALPLVSALCDDFNMGLAPYFGTSVVGFDITEIPELNENQSDVIKRYNDAPGFKPNDLRESLGYGRDLGKQGETFLVKQGYSTLEDITMPVDFDTTNLDNANANDYADS